MCQLGLIVVFDHTYQFQHVYSLLELNSESIEMCQVLLITVPDHTFQFQHVHRLGIRKYWDVPSTIN